MFFVTSKLLLLHLAIFQCTILRLPECGKLDAEFSVVHTNKKLEFGFLKSIFCTIYECYKFCILNNECASVNFHQVKGICELLSSENIPFHLKDDAGWNHIETPLKMKIGSKCESGDFCKATMQCQDTCMLPNHFQCVVPKYDLLANYLEVSQSSTFEDMSPELAIDNNLGQTHTKLFSSTDPALALLEISWWKVIFKHKVIVHNVEIWNRVDCCTEDLSDAKIMVIDVEEKEMLCNSLGNMADVSNKLVICSTPLRGFGIKIQSNKAKELVLNEVLVYGVIA